MLEEKRRAHLECAHPWFISVFPLCIIHVAYTLKCVSRQCSHPYPSKQTSFIHRYINTTVQ